MYFVVECTTMSAPRSSGFCKIRRRKRVVDRDADARAVRAEPRCGLDIDQLHERIGRCLEPDHARGSGQARGYRRRVARIDVAERQTVAPEHLIEQPERAPVEIVGDDDVIACRRED